MSSISFVSECLAQALRLPRFRQDAKIHGVAGLSHDSHSQSFTNLVVSPMQKSTKEINVKAVIVPRVTCDLPSQPVPFKADWSHLADLALADPDFGRPGKIDLLLGVEVFSVEKEVSLVALVQSVEPLIPFDRFSCFSHLKRVTAWIL